MGKTEERPEPLKSIMAISEWLVLVPISLTGTALCVVAWARHGTTFDMVAMCASFAWTFVCCLMTMEKCYQAAIKAGYTACSSRE
jgi:hypothetical protein